MAYIEDNNYSCFRGGLFPQRSENQEYIRSEVANYYDSTKTGRSEREKFADLQAFEIIEEIEAWSDADNLSDVIIKINKELLIRSLKIRGELGEEDRYDQRDFLMTRFYLNLSHSRGDFFENLKDRFMNEDIEKSDELVKESIYLSDKILEVTKSVFEEITSSRLFRNAIPSDGKKAYCP